MQAGVVNIVSAPSKELAFLVRKYVLLKTTDNKKIADKHIPDGSASIVFNLSGNIGFADSTIKLPACFLTFPHLGHVKLLTVHPAETFIVICKTTVLTRLFHLRLLQLNPPPYLDAENIFDRSLWQQIKEAGSYETRIKIFENYLLHSANIRKYFPDKIDNASEYIYVQDGLLNIRELASSIGLNVRSLRRNFKNRTGLCPKSFSRIVRLNFLWRSAAATGRADFQAMAFMGDFFDQSHFIHDFEEITGECPGDFFGRDLKKVKLLSGFDQSPV